jgi:hypothetical protein
MGIFFFTKETCSTAAAARWLTQLKIPKGGTLEKEKNKKKQASSSLVNQAADWLISYWE